MDDELNTMVTKLRQRMMEKRKKRGKPANQRVYSDLEIKKMIAFARMYGVRPAARMLGIPKSTVHFYFKQWKKEHGLE